MMGADVSAQTVADSPTKEIKNGILSAKLYLPDAAKSFYRGTRFDWSGVIVELEYKGHSYYGPWFTRTDPNVRDFVYDGPDIVAGPCSAMTGPAEEFSNNGSALGFEAAKPGGTFVKIGVGVLRKPDEAKYSAYHLYEIVDHGKWRVQVKPDSLTFIQEVRDPVSGYGYIYRKTVRLVAGKPEMLLEHSLQNVGSKPIESSVYDHNFLVLDKQATGPDFAITLPFAIKVSDTLDEKLAAVNGNQILFQKVLTGEDRVFTTVGGFTSSADDYKIQIENKKLKAGVRVQGNRPLAREALWSIRSVISVEPFIDMSIPPGSEFSWEYRYEYYVVP
ncbi:MAG: hypothetical protein M3Y72_16255 [Acidobacteriota bacterium]|nr:hypothetical protein [Acidobacteriota bacterium]